MAGTRAAQVPTGRTAPVEREFSAGGVLVRTIRGRPMVAAIRPNGRDRVWALPKGRIDPGEQAQETALREVAEETGARGRALRKLGDVKYWFSWDGDRVFKVVSFFLVQYSSGRLGDLPEQTRHEVTDVRWLPLEEAPRLLAYRGEQEMAEKATAALAELGL
jgi:8-oxo-dGTP pyrophosphatase MutT (NUDIX family)